MIPKTYEHLNFEDKIYRQWEKSGYFKSEVNMAKPPKYDHKVDGKPFVISMPPSNVTGRLHIGHALGFTLQDMMIRYHRLLGEPALWLPGTDHAGIATQTVVDKELKKKGIDKNIIGREKFVKEVWKWKEKYGDIINIQTRKMGASCDWSRERFTLDEGLNQAVKEAFVNLYKKGLIYRGEYIVNWCPRCQTAIADDEVSHIEQKARLYYFKYDKNFPITIATTRPETKLGDTGVAVNPSDIKYKKYIGQTFEVNIDGLKRKIKIFGDRSVDPKFGTGAVGITPAHSMADWKMAEDNNLPKIKVIDENGRMTKEAGRYADLKTKEAGQKLIEYLKANDLLEKEGEFTNNLSVCYRCETAIEPIPSLQWFVAMKPLAEKAKKTVREGKIKIIPKQFEKVYFHWMDNIRDWCISRQLWWGHRLPVYYRKPEAITKKQDTSNKQIPNNNSTIQQFNNDIFVGVNPPDDIENWEQDPDVLDTWFSSALWPFSTLGWPKKTNDYEYFYPTTVMETGYDILFFWVARMIMMGLELTGKIPFEMVYLHGIVRDEHNRKMSKSLGNALDPLTLIENYGSDALRMALVVGGTPGQDVAMGESKIKGFRNFSNKIWNASRFVTLRVSEGDLQTGDIGLQKIENLNTDNKTLTDADKAILDLHKKTIKSVTEKIEKFRFSQAGEELYDYFWHQFCDQYIEEAKKQFPIVILNESEESHKKALGDPSALPQDDKVKNTKKILIKILSETLVMLHPFVPFITEAVWQELREIYPKLSKSIMIAKWPETPDSK